MIKILENVRFKTLILDIVFVIMGCIFAMFLSSHLLTESSNVQDMNFMLFVGLMISYIIFCFVVHYKYGYLKLKKFRNALHIMYHTDKTRVKIGNEKDNYGYFSKDKIGFIYYDKI